MECIVVHGRFGRMADGLAGLEVELDDFAVCRRFAIV
jgi:hypothetical protein